MVHDDFTFTDISLSHVKCLMKLLAEELDESASCILIPHTLGVLLFDVSVTLQLHTVYWQQYYRVMKLYSDCNWYSYVQHFGVTAINEVWIRNKNFITSGSFKPSPSLVLSLQWASLKSSHKSFIVSSKLDSQTHFPIPVTSRNDCVYIKYLNMKPKLSG